MSRTAVFRRIFGYKADSIGLTKRSGNAEAENRISSCTAQPFDYIAPPAMQDTAADTNRSHALTFLGKHG